MPEKDTKKTDEKAGAQTNTAQLTPEMLLLVNAITNAYGAVQQKMVVARTQTTTTTTGEDTDRQFTGPAKIAVEKFNDILAGLELKPPLTPALNPISAPTQDKKIRLDWRMPQPERLDALTGFKIQRAEEPTGLPTGPFIDLPILLERDKTSHTDGPLPGNITYHYRVVALTRNRGEFVSNVEKILIT